MLPNIKSTLDNMHTEVKFTFITVLYVCKHELHAFLILGSIH